jgi:chaperone modulatory protein CbpM
MAETHVVATEVVIVEEHVSFTLMSLCQASGADNEQVHALVSEGLLQPAGQGPDDWRFSGDALPQTRRALRLARDLELSVSGVALVMDLLAEIDRLRSKLRRR